MKKSLFLTFALLAASASSYGSETVESIVAGIQIPADNVLGLRAFDSNLQYYTDLGLYPLFAVKLGNSETKDYSKSGEFLNKLVTEMNKHENDKSPDVGAQIFTDSLHSVSSDPAIDHELSTLNAKTKADYNVAMQIALEPGAREAYDRFLLTFQTQHNEALKKALSIPEAPRTPDDLKKRFDAFLAAERAMLEKMDIRQIKLYVGALFLTAFSEEKGPKGDLQIIRETYGDLEGVFEQTFIENPLQLAAKKQVTYMTMKADIQFEALGSFIVLLGLSKLSSETTKMNSTSKFEFTNVSPVQNK